jgi:hypothetical protein
LRRAKLSGERKNRWQRDKDPKPMILQPRDIEIMNAIYEFGFMTRDQIQRLLDFNCTTKANIRLRKLFDHAFLARRFLPISRGSSKALYFLGPKGVPIVCEQNGGNPGEIKRRQSNLFERKDLFFSHDLLVNEIRLAVCRAMNRNGLKLDKWMNAAKCLQEYGVFDPGSNRELKKTFRPDGYFRYFYQEKIFGCFLEFDRSTMSNGRFQSKIQSYLEYAQSGFW